MAWYTDRLGLPLLLRDDPHQFALLRAGAGRLSLKAGDPQPGSTVLAFEVADLDRELERLAAQNIRPETPIKISPEGYRRVFVHDPEGQRLALFDWGGQANPGW